MPQKIMEGVNSQTHTQTQTHVNKQHLKAIKKKRERNDRQRVEN